MPQTTQMGLCATARVRFVVLATFIDSTGVGRQVFLPVISETGI